MTRSADSVELGEVAAPQGGRARPCDVLRVLVVTNMYPTPREPWFGSFVRDQVEDLRDLGIDLRLAIFDGRSRVLNYARAAHAVRRIVTQERFDIVHAHYGLTGAAVVLQRRVPVVTTFHGGDYTGASRWQRHVSWLVSRCSVPVFVSEEGRRALGHPFAQVIPAGVDTDLFQPIDRRTARRRLGWDEDARYVLLPGNRSIRAKRPDLFDGALDEARKAMPGLRGAALGGLSREKTALVLNAVDVTLMTSDREGSPLTVRESLACLTPVVSVEVGDVAQVVEGLPGCGIFERDPRALARGVIDGLAAGRHPDLRRRAEETSRKAVAARVVSLYFALAGLEP